MAVVAHLPLNSQLYFNLILLSPFSPPFLLLFLLHLSPARHLGRLSLSSKEKEDEEQRGHTIQPGRHTWLKAP